MMFRRPHATFRLSLFLSICLLLLVAGCAGETPKQEKNSRPVPVRVVALERGNLPYELLLTGELIAPERAVIAPTVSGRISRLTVDMGDRVRQGERLVELDAAILTAQLAEARAGRRAAEAAVVRAKTEFDNSAAELTRLEALTAKGFATQQELDAARTTATADRASLRTAEAQSEQAAASLGALTAQLAEMTLTAPFDGLVEDRYLDAGNVATPGTPILALSRTAPVLARFTVPERHIGAVTAAEQAGDLRVELLVDAFPTESFQGRVARVAPVLEPESRSRATEAEFPNDDHRLLPGMYGRVRLRLGLVENALLLPLESLVDSSSAGAEAGQSAMTAKVYVVEDNTARLREVKIGLRRGDRGEVLDGLDDQSLVVVEGRHLLRDGAAVLSETDTDAQNGGE